MVLSPNSMLAVANKSAHVQIKVNTVRFNNDDRRLYLLNLVDCRCKMISLE